MADKIKVKQKDSIPGVPLPNQDLAILGIVEAIYNCGRWLVRCPIDPMGHHSAQVQIEQTDFICPGCYPDITAIAFQKRADDLFEPVPDKEKRGLAMALASNDDNIFIIKFPDDVDEILATLRPRPAQNMSWLPGETIEDLQAQNIGHGIFEIGDEVSIIDANPPIEPDERMVD